VGAGLQDRVIQVYEGLVYMDFARELMESQGHGGYESLDPALLPNVYVAYRKSLSEGTEVFHNNIRSRFEEGDPQVVQAMKRWAAIAAEGCQALLERDHAAFDRLIDENFDLRASIYKISEGNLQMVRAARAIGATAKFAGSGGAVVGTLRDGDHRKRLIEEMAKIDVAVLTPKM
jgi:glucuronokinase